MEITKDTKLIRSVGGSRVVHAIGCPWIKDWNIEGCEPVDKLRLNKMKLCPTCRRMILTSQMAKDYDKHRTQYAKLYDDLKVSAAVLDALYSQARAKLELRNNILYIHSKQDDWYIDLNFDEVHLFHNNYQVNQRAKGRENTFTKGFHEHELFNESNSGKFYEALRQIIKYDHKKADRVHKSKRKSKKNTMTFSEFDQEYWGFTS